MGRDRSVIRHGVQQRGRGGAAGNKFRMSLGLPVAAVMNCADNSGAKNLYIMACQRLGSSPEQAARCRPGRYGDGHCEEGQARSAQER